MVFAECLTVSAFWAWIAAALLIVTIFFVIAFIILTLIQQGRSGRWGWFIITLIAFLFLGLGLFVALIYWIVWMVSPNFRKKK